MNDNGFTELRYLVQSANELRDDCKREIAERLAEEGDMQLRMHTLADDVSYSRRSIRSHINQSELLQKEQEAFGRETLVYVSSEEQNFRDDLAQKAVNVALSCLKQNERFGLPRNEGDEL